MFYVIADLERIDEMFYVIADLEWIDELLRSSRTWNGLMKCLRHCGLDPQSQLE